MHTVCVYGRWWRDLSVQMHRPMCAHVEEVPLCTEEVARFCPQTPCYCLEAGFLTKLKDHSFRWAGWSVSPWGHLSPPPQCLHWRHAEPCPTSYTSAKMSTSCAHAGTASVLTHWAISLLRYFKTLTFMFERISPFPDDDDLLKGFAEVGQDYLFRNVRPSPHSDN